MEMWNEGPGKNEEERSGAQTQGQGEGEGEADQQDMDRKLEVGFVWQGGREEREAGCVVLCMFFQLLSEMGFENQDLNREILKVCTTPHLHDLHERTKRAPILFCMSVWCVSLCV